LDSSDITPADVQAAVAQFVAEEDASDDKFRGEQLVLGNPEESDLRNMIGLDDNRIFGKLLENTLKTMEVEWYTNGDEEDIANWEYVVKWSTVLLAAQSGSRSMSKDPIMLQYSTLGMRG